MSLYLSALSYLSLLAVCNMTVINIGHIFLTASEIPVINMALEDLNKSNILPAGYDFRVFSKLGCAAYHPNMTRINGAVDAIDMYFNNDVSAFFGPACSDECVVVGRMAAAINWNVPVLTYLSSDNALADKTVFSTLARTSVISATFFAQALAKVLVQNGWNKVAYVGSTSTLSMLNRPTVVATLASVGIDVHQMIVNAGATWQDIVKSRAMIALKANARVILVFLDGEMNSSVPFMAAAHSMGYKADPDFVFITFSVTNQQVSRPWDADYDGMSYPYLREAYEGSYILRVDGLDYESISSFRQKLFDTQNFTIPRGDDSLTMPLYDAVMLYGTALNKSLTATGDRNIYMNGSFMFEQMKNVQFDGLTDQVVINDDGERITSYQFVLIPKQVNRIYTLLMEIHASRLRDCDPTVDGNLCYPYNITITESYLPIAWPPAEPKCGYSYERCDTTLFYVLGGVLIFPLIGGVIAYYVAKKRKENLLYLMPWQVPMESVKMLASGTVVSSMISMTSLRNSDMSANSKSVTSSLQQALVFGNTRSSTKQASHDNLNTFVGLTCNNIKNELFFLWKLCIRGSLQDIIANDDLKLDTDFKASFINDIIKGLLYLHNSEIKEHGALRSSNCLVDNHWTVKLSDFGVNRAISDLLKHREIEYADNGVQEPTNYKLLYLSPEHLRTYLSHKKYETSQAGDIYALGIIMHETLYRMEPFSDREDSVEDIIRKIVSLDRTTMRAIRPSFPREPYVHPEAMLIIQQCWSEAADQRPNVRRIKKVIDATLRTSSGTITDHMMKLMEEYAGNLEKIVHERTAMLEETQQQAERLLLQMLPKSVAQDLKQGRHVAPQTYAEATVLFCDIAGFTSLCSTSNPLEIVTFLNGVFSGFDTFIADHSAYKVETIGDAYMVVSGVPVVIGDRHVETIASIAVLMKEFVSDFKVVHRPDLQLQIRTGFHSGPVAAGVVGLAAPRYCLFGDTVNMASRMESNSETGRIHISSTSYNLLNSSSSNEFDMERRGYIEIKGKGQQLTYWLNGRSEDVIHDTTVKKIHHRTIVPKRIKQNYMS
uniref:Guanylate cyclase n=1 Tax=Plectus sambesii TaxID=2011161 RepID=A0A914VRF2_9BILA